MNVTILIRCILYLIYKMLLDVLHLIHKMIRKIRQNSKIRKLTKEIKIIRTYVCLTAKLMYVACAYVILSVSITINLMFSYLC